MDTPKLTVTETPEEGGVVLALDGELDIYTCPALKARLCELVDQHRSVTVDLAQVPWVDSAGLGVLVGGLRRFKAESLELRLRTPSPRVADVLRVTRLYRMFEMEL